MFATFVGAARARPSMAPDVPGGQVALDAGVDV